jgi:hypothetical protein
MQWALPSSFCKLSPGVPFRDLRRQKKLEVQIASFSLTPGDLDDLLEDFIPKTYQF